MLLHASCVAIDNKAVLLVGPAGAGKSDLALRLIDEGAQLISDDQTKIYLEKDKLIAAAPDVIKGLFEVRHVGLIKVPYIDKAPVALYVDLVPMDEKIERLPDDDKMMLLDHPVRRLKLPSFAASTPDKIRAVLRFPLASSDAGSESK